MNHRRKRHVKRRDFLKTVAFASTGLAVSGNMGCQPNTHVHKPNILYLMADQFRGDCLGCAGNSVIKTPNLDSIAKDGVIFTNSYSSTPTCTPARSALLTGLSPWHHGMLGYGRVAAKYPVELPQAVRDAGYYTFGIGKMHWYPQKSLHGFHGTLVDESGRVETEGFISDYRRWFKEQAPELNPDATGIGWNDYRAKAYVLPEELHPTHWTAQMAVDFIEKYDRPQPFLLKVSFARPHSPYDPPSRFMEMYNESDMPKPHVGNWADKYAEHPDPPPYSLWHGDLGVSQAQRSRRGYYGSVSFIDEQIGRILNALKKQGLYDNTLIIFCADHGDMLGDHHLWRKSYAYEASAQIPFLLRWPKDMGMEKQRGNVVLQPVELRDILPTFLDAAKAAIPEHVDGKSLLGLVRGETNNWRPFIDLEHDVCYSKENHWNALTDGHIKYIFHAFDGREQLFDLRNDPGELHDLAADPGYRATLKTWRDRMIEHLSERGEPFVANGKLLTRPERMLYSPNYPGSV